MSVWRISVANIMGAIDLEREQVAPHTYSEKSSHLESYSPVVFEMIWGELTDRLAARADSSACTIAPELSSTKDLDLRSWCQLTPKLRSMRPARHSVDRGS